MANEDHVAAVRSGPTMEPTLVASPTSAQAAALNDLDGFIRNAMADWHVPGAAVAVVKDDVIVYLRAFGVRRLGYSDPVDAETLFPIASATKAFTVDALGILMDEGNVDWDAPVSKYLTDVRFPTVELTAEVTVRDILSHRTGIADDLPAYWGTTASSSDLLQSFSSLAVHAGLRHGFEYNNLMYLAGGEIIARVSGCPWEVFVRERFLQPLGMSSTAPVKACLSPTADLSAGHSQDAAGTVHEVPLLDLTNIAPAGGIISNALDMARWIRFQLSDGMHNGRQLLKAETLAETHAPQVLIPRRSPFEPFFSDNVFSTYNLGWMSSDYHGHLLIQHPGITDAVTSLVALMPDQKAGVVVLTNLANQWLPSAILYGVFDALLGNQQRDWSTEYLRRPK